MCVWGGHVSLRVYPRVCDINLMFRSAKVQPFFYPLCPFVALPCAIGPTYPFVKYLYVMTPSGLTYVAHSLPIRYTPLDIAKCPLLSQPSLYLGCPVECLSGKP